MTFRDELTKRTEEVQKTVYQYLPEENGYQNPAGGNELQYDGRRKASASPSDAGDISAVWGQFTGGGAVYGGNGDDSYTFVDS